MDSLPDAANRMNRCVKMAKKGCWKKADNALNPTKIANIHLNNNFEKTKSKFPYINFLITQLKLKVMICLMMLKRFYLE